MHAAVQALREWVWNSNDDHEVPFLHLGEFYHKNPEHLETLYQQPLAELANMFPNDIAVVSTATSSMSILRALKPSANVSNLPIEMIAVIVSFLTPLEVVIFLMSLNWSLKMIKTFVNNRRLNGIQITNIAKEYRSGLNLDGTDMRPTPYTSVWYEDKGKIHQTIVIADGVTSIDRDVFADLKTLTHVKIPDSVTSIGDGAFVGCKSLISVEIPNSVTSIGDDAFSDCKSLINVNIPGRVSKIGKYAFAGCKSLINVKIPGSVRSIDDGCFDFCKSLTTVDIADGITRIGDRAFCGCESLTDVVFPESVRSIGEGCFLYCNSLLVKSCFQKLSKECVIFPLGLIYGTWREGL